MQPNAFVPIFTTQEASVLKKVSTEETQRLHGEGTVLKTCSWQMLPGIWDMAAEHDRRSASPSSLLHSPPAPHDGPDHPAGHPWGLLHRKSGLSLSIDTAHKTHRQAVPAPCWSSATCDLIVMM